MKAKPLPKIDRNTGKQIGVRWRIEVYNANRKRYEPVPVAQIPFHIRNSQDATEVEAYIKSQNAINDAVKHRAMVRSRWMHEYHDLEKYLSMFAEFQREQAPNSWENDVHYLKTYAFYYFLTESNINNINQWHLKFSEFRAWLKTVKPLKYNKDSLSLNTQQKVIKALNRFLDYSFRLGWIDYLHKCPGYPRDATSIVTIDDTFRCEEIIEIYDALLKVRPTSADLFWVSLHTGLRVNEAIGLAMDFVIQGPMDGAASSHVHNALLKYNLDNYYGYIALDSQPVKGAVKRNLCKISRRPLKHRKRLGLENTRLIPIFDKKTWNILVDRYEAAALLLQSERERGIADITGRDVLLFQGITKAMYYNDLSKVLKVLNLRHRSPHKTRHTFFTSFYSMVSEDLYLAKIVGGHRDVRDIERYNHIQEEISREIKIKLQQNKKLIRV
jgi:integrase